MFENFNARRISIKEAKRILNRNGNVYSDEEMKKIVDYLYTLAELAGKNQETRTEMTHRIFSGCIDHFNLTKRIHKFVSDT